MRWRRAAAARASHGLVAAWRVKRGVIQMAGLESTQAHKALALGHYLDIPVSGSGMSDSAMKGIEEAHSMATALFARKAGKPPSCAQYDEMVALWRGFVSAMPREPATAGFLAACSARLRASADGSLPDMDGARNFGGTVRLHLAALAACCKFMAEAPKAQQAAGLARKWAESSCFWQPFQRDALLTAMATRLPMPLSATDGRMDNAHLSRMAADALNASTDHLLHRHQAIQIAAKLAGETTEPIGISDYADYARAFSAHLLARESAAA